MKLTLKNTLHYKTVTLKNLMRGVDYRGHNAIEISVTTYRKLKKLLCGKGRDCCHGAALTTGDTDHKIIVDAWPDVNVKRYFILLNQREA